MPTSALTEKQVDTTEHHDTDASYVKSTTIVSTRTLAALGCLLAALYMLPYAILWKDSRIKIHDNIESNLAIQARLASDGNADFILGGLPPAATASMPQILGFFSELLPAFEAYLAWDLTLRLFAFLGMFGLLLEIPHQNRNLACLAAVAFSWLPYYNVLGLSAAGLPMMALAVVWLIGREVGTPRRVIGLTIFGTFPLLASIAVTPLVGASITIAMVFHWIRTSTKPYWLFTGLLLLTAVTLWANWPLFEGVLGSDSITWHRDERVREPPSLDSIRSIIEKSFFSQYHAEALPAPFVWSSVIISLILGASALRKPGRVNTIAILALIVIPAVFVIDPPTRKFLLIYSLSIGIALSMYATQPSRQWVLGIVGGLGFILLTASFWIAYDAGLLDWLPMGSSFKYSRLYFFLPFVFGVMFFLSLSYIAAQSRSGGLIAYGLLGCQMMFCIINADWSSGIERDTLTYAEFEARDVFDRVDEFIDAPKNSYRIACVGFLPSTAHLNGFNTVGGYWGLYPLERKHAMRLAIASELDKSPDLKTYFDDWGNRCYVWSSELFAHEHEHDIRRMDDPPIKLVSFDINVFALHEMGARYVFSSLEIANHEDLKLRYVGSISSKQSSKHGLSLWIYEITAS